RAINFEVRRQIELIEDGGTVVQETRLYDPDADQTRSMRSKEDAHDYRYLPDPDLPALVIEPERIEAVRAAMPELPADKRRRYAADFGLGDYDTLALTASRGTADYFEATVASLALPGQPASPGAVKQAANWIMVEVAAQLNREGLDIADARVAPAQLARLVNRITDGTISGKIARDIFQTLWADAVPGERASPDAIDRSIDERGLRQISDSSALEPLVDRVLAENERSV